MELNKNLYTDNYNSLDEWLELIINEDSVYPRFRIPFNEWLQDYLKNIGNKNVDEVKMLLRCLLESIHRKLDETAYESYIHLKNCNIDTFEDMAERMSSNERYKRIERGYYAWEGATWILELLAYSPYQAIIALEGYAYAQDNLTDDRIIGIKQCIDIIYEKFIFLDKPNRNLLKLKPTEFEWLIEELYSRMGYETELTPPTRDGGKDIIATVKRKDGTEKVYIECKLYDTSELSCDHVRSFAFTVIKDEINRGIIFCTGYASDDMQNIDKRITILNYKDICTLLNSYLGSDWDSRLDKIIAYKRRQHGK